MKNFWLKLKQYSRVKKIVLSIFLCIGIMIALLLSLVATDAGSHWAVKKAANILDITLGKLNGNLLTGFDVTSIDYHKNDMDIHAEKISFRWQPLTLFYTAVSLQSLSADNIRIQLPPSTTEPEIYEWPSLAQPLRIEMGSVKLRNIHIQQGTAQYALNGLSGSLSLGAFHLRVKDVYADNNMGGLKINGQVGLRYPYALDLDTEWNLKPRDEQALTYSGKAKITGDIKTILAQHELLQPAALKTTAKISPALHDKNSKPAAVIITDWSEQPLLPVLAAQFSESGKLHGLKPILFTKGHVEVHGWLDVYQITSTLQAKTADSHLAIDLIAKGTSSFSSNTAQLQIGKLELVSVPLNTTVKVDKNKQNNITTPHSLSLKGTINFLPYVTWDLTAQGEHVNLEDFFANWPSDFHLNLDSVGEFESEQLRLAVNNIKAGGTLRQYPISAEGEVHGDSESWGSSDLKLALGDNQLIVKGSVGKTLALDWKINAPSLNQVEPSMRGSVVSSGSLSGEIAKPNIQASAQIKQFSWGDYALETATLTLISQAATDKYHLVLDAKQLQLESQHFSHFALNGDGNISQHLLVGQLDSPDYGSLMFNLSSSWADNVWRGQWRDFSIHTKKIPRWNLLSGTPMQADAKSADFGKLCLTTSNDLPVEIDPEPSAKQRVQDVPNICMAGTWNSASGSSAAVTIGAVPLSSLRAWFKPEVTLHGVLDGDFSVRAAPKVPTTMSAHLRTRDAKILYQFQGGKVETYPLQKGEINATLKNNQLNAALVLDWASYGSVNADVQYSVANGKIQGKGNAALPNIAPLEGLLPFLNNVQGSAGGKFILAGTLTKPEITGDFRVTGASANLPKLGLELKNISLQVTSPSINSAHVEGAVTSGDGTLITQGDFVNLGAPDWHWQANVFGAGIRIIQQTQLSATISPNLKLSANAQSIELTGSTEIPWARANVKNLPESAIRVSNDAIIVEKNDVSMTALTQKSLPVHTNVILYFGDDVRFKGFGLDTRLSGKANVLKEENRQIFTTGYVAVDKGVYKAYGQELSVERGRLIFQGPYDNPGLDIRAVRVTDDTVTAGLDIGGTLQHPKSTVFAIPAKTDSEAMAILLTGKSLSDSSKDDAYAIIGAIGKLGMSQGDSMTSDIVRKFGLDEVSIRADKGIEQSELMVGKYVTPKLFLHYIVGLFDQAFSLGMTYKINDKVHIEAESGKTQSLDVIYKIER